MGLKRIELAGRWINVEERGAGRPVLLVHGFPLDHTMWTEQIDALSAGFRVIAPDLPGFGHSDPVQGDLTMDGMADELARLLDAMQIDQPIVYCGLSMGGYVGWRFVDRYADRVWRLIQCDTKAAADAPEAAKTRRETADRALREGSAVIAQAMKDRLFAPQTLTDNPEIVAAMESVMLATPRETIAAALRGMAERPDSTGLVANLEIPTLLLGGEHDAITPPAEMRRVADVMPQARFVEIPNAGHVAPLESPAAVNSAILDFLSN